VGSNPRRHGVNVETEHQADERRDRHGHRGDVEQEHVVERGAERVVRKVVDAVEQGTEPDRQPAARAPASDGRDGEKRCDEHERDEVVAAQRGYRPPLLVVQAVESR
jgi:hypothetical protein